MKEATSLGAALMAGSAAGIDIFKVAPGRLKVDIDSEASTDVFYPNISAEGTTLCPRGPT